MEIIPRSQSGLAPPRGNPTGPFEKNIIVIHYTCSPNGILSIGQEQSIMRAWQNDHESKYGAWDILQAYSCFQSGRVYENRVWTSNSGAIYNAGGWSTRGVGIENQGDFHGNVIMGEPQYSSLVALCADIYHRPGFKPLAGRWIFGHQELYPCRPGDPQSTDCPANLLAQFVSNGKLQNDVMSGGAAPQPQKPREETVLYQGPGYHSTDKKTFIFLDCWSAKNDYWFKTVGSAKNLKFKLTQRSGLEHITAPQNVDGIHDHNMQAIAAQKPMTDSYVLTVTSDTPVSMSLREVPK